jgi:hypothetical protein
MCEMVLTSFLPRIMVVHVIQLYLLTCTVLTLLLYIIVNDFFAHILKLLVFPTCKVAGIVCDETRSPNL